MLEVEVDDVADFEAIAPRIVAMGAVAGLEHVVVLPINERYLPEHVASVAVAIRGAYRELCGG